MNKIQYDTVYFAAWWLCVVTLPWTIPLNSFSIVALVGVWLAEGHYEEKWQRIRKSAWTLPFLFFFALHIVGLIYTREMSSGYFEIEKKLAFVALPLVAAGGRRIREKEFALLKKSFIASCLFVVVISLVYTAVALMGSAPSLQNFDLRTNEHYHHLNPGASPWWEYFSYIQVGEWIDIHPAYFSMYLIFCIAMIFTGIVDRKRVRVVEGAIIMLFIFFIVLLSSRMAIVTGVAVVAWLLFYPIRGNLNRVGIGMAASMGVILLGLIWMNPVSRFRIVQEPLTTPLRADVSVEEWNSVNLRLLEWKAGLHAVSNAWWLGSGTGDGQAVLQEFYTHFSPSTAGLDYNAHDQYLQTAVELGSVGLVSLLICLFVPVRLPHPGALHIAFMILFGLMCLTESMLARQKGIVFFTLFQSLFLRYNQSE